MVLCACGQIARLKELPNFLLINQLHIKWVCFSGFTLGPLTLDYSILHNNLTYNSFRGSSYDLLSDCLAWRQQKVLFHCDLLNWVLFLLVYLMDQF